MSNINFLQWIVNQLWNDLTTTDYLSNLIKQEGYDPYKFQWDLSTVPVQNYQEAAQKICTTAYPSANPPWTFSGPPNISISGSVITGLSNVVVSNPPPTVSPDQSGQYDGFLTITVTFSNLAIENGPFTLTQECCQPPEGSYECPQSPPPQPSTGSGTYDLTIVQSTGTCKFAVTVQPVNVVVQEVMLAAQNTASNIQITVDITSFPSGTDPATWNQYAEGQLTSPAAFTALINEISTTLNGSNELSALSTVLTYTIQGWINSGNYPFNAGAVEAY